MLVIAPPSPLAMDAAALGDFERRAADAERRLAALELGGGGGGGGVSVDALWEVRKLLGKARAESNATMVERDEVCMHRRAWLARGARAEPGARGCTCVPKSGGRRGSEGDGGCCVAALR